MNFSITPGPVPQSVKISVNLGKSFAFVDAWVSRDSNGYGVDPNGESPHPGSEFGLAGKLLFPDDEGGNVMAPYGRFMADTTGKIDFIVQVPDKFEFHLALLPLGATTATVSRLVTSGDYSA